MRQSGRRYRIDNIDNLWRKASKIIDDPCFGFKAAEVWHPSNLGALGYAMLASNTLRTSLERLDRYHGFLSYEEFMKLDETQEGLRLTLVLSRKDGNIPEQNVAALARIFHELTSRDREDGRACPPSRALRGGGRATGQAQGFASEAYLNSTSQGGKPENARKDAHIIRARCAPPSPASGFPVSRSQ
jgi:hypothetical protein